MKKLKHLILLTLSLGCLFAIAQAIKQDINSSIGNGDAMKNNLNVPNAVNPAKDNIQSYERDGVELDKNNHTKSDLSNSYNRNTYESTTK